MLKVSGRYGTTYLGTGTGTGMSS